jgi:(p)ppGpp synthase/HD superfamily hydrolase
LGVTWSQDRYNAALRFAAEAHRTQTVPGTDLPYLMHLASVAMETIAGCAADAAIDADLAVQCALLHDSIEDAGVSEATLAERFGADVAAGVAALSKRKGFAKADAMRDSLTRIRERPHAVWLVKLADRITNLQPPPKHWTAEKIVTYRAEAEVILRELGPASPFLAKRLAEKIAAYAR